MDGGWLDVYVTDFTHNQWPLYRKSSTTLINLWTPLLGLEDIHQEQIFWACDRVNGEMPPTTLRGDLSQEDLDRVNALRRQMWGRGAQAFGLGGFLGGYGCWSLMRFQQLHPSHALAKALPKLSGKHVVMWTLVDAVLLSYVAVAYAGKKGAVAVRGEFERKQREGVQTDSSFEVKTEVKKPIQSFRRPPPDTPPHPRPEERVPRNMLEVVEAKRRVAQANEDSHVRRLEAIEAKKRRDREGDGGTPAGTYKW